MIIRRKIRRELDDGLSIRRQRPSGGDGITIRRLDGATDRWSVATYLSVATDQFFCSVMRSPN